MCVIICCEKDYPKYDTLKSAQELNSDGGGIAWIESNTVHWQKGINAKQIMKLIKKRKVRLPFVIHFRIGTVGGKIKSLCHPFPITNDVSLAIKGEANAVLFHNGHWNNFNDVAQKTIIEHHIKFPNGEFSDSRVMAWLASIHGKTFLNFIQDQKITVLTNQGIMKYGKFDDIDGKKKEDSISVSNTYFDNSCYSNNYTVTRTDTKKTDDLDGKQYCDYCDSLKPLDKFSFNDECCNTCFDDSYEKHLLKEKKASMNEVLNENMINAKQYSKGDYKTQFDMLRDSRYKRMYEK